MREGLWIVPQELVATDITFLGQQAEIVCERGCLLEPLASALQITGECKAFCEPEAADNKTALFARPPMDQS